MEVEEEEPREDKRNGETKSTDISALAEELVDKLECFKVGQEKISNLKMMAVKIETLYGAWSAGALTPQYLLAVLTAASNVLALAERERLSEPPWIATWDRTTRSYQFQHETTGEMRLAPAPSAQPPPPLPP